MEEETFIVPKEIWDSVNDQLVKSNKELEEKNSYIDKLEKKLIRMQNNKDNDPRYLGIPNICFSISSDTDERTDTILKEERLKDGFDQSETWSLNNTIAKFIIPRLERYLEIVDDSGLISKEHHKEFLDDTNHFLNALKMYKEKEVWEYSDSEQTYLEKGIKKFHKIFYGLWW